VKAPALARRRAVGLHAAVVIGLLALSVVVWWHVWVTGQPTSTITCQCADTSQAVWFLRWTAWSIAHGHSPLLSNAIYAGQGGANMLVNTSWIFPGLLLAPVTWLFGPIASFNVAVTIAPVVSGWSMFALARAVTRFVPGAVLAALLWGFSPFLLGGLPVGHLNLTWLFFPPLASLVVYDLVRGGHRAVPLGCALGALVVVQFFTGTEVLAICLLLGVIAVCVFAAVSWRVVWERRRQLVCALAAAAVVSGVVLAYPLWFLLDGPRHIVGVPWPGVPAYGSLPSWTVEAGADVHHTSALLRFGGYYGPGFLPAPFLGVGLLAFLGASIVVWARRRLAVVCAVSGAASWALSLGTSWGSKLAHPLNPKYAHWWLPWTAVSHVPLLSDVFPTRMALLVTFAAAVLLALSLDGWWSMARKARDLSWAERLPRSARRLSPVAVQAVVGAAATAFALWSLAPIASGEPLPFVLHSSSPPAWFSVVASHLRAGTVVMVDPDPSSGETAAMGWQAEAAMQVRIVGGYAIVPGGDGRQSVNVVPLGGAPRLLDDLSFGFAPLPATSAHNLSVVRSAFRSWGVDVVVVTDQARAEAYAARFFAAVIGRAPLHQRGALVWYGLDGGSGPGHS